MGESAPYEADSSVLEAAAWHAVVKRLSGSASWQWLGDRPPFGRLQVDQCKRSVSACWADRIGGRRREFSVRLHEEADLKGPVTISIVGGPRVWMELDDARVTRWISPLYDCLEDLSRRLDLPWQYRWEGRQRVRVEPVYPLSPGDESLP